MSSLERARPDRVARGLKRRWLAYHHRWPAAWSPLPTPVDGAVLCNICRWQGERFEGVAHVESAACPRCGAIARDRFLHLAMTWERRPRKGERILETSPRLGERYREEMARYFDYVSSDYDQSAHIGAIRIDLQDIDLPDASVDLILTPHVLEHVPDTDAALRELRRITKPGGRMALQVPVLQGRTAPPAEPEFHGDNTPVFWRFSYDLTDRLMEHGWRVHTLVTQPWIDAVAAGAWTDPDPVDTTFDVPQLLEAARSVELTPAAPEPVTRWLGLEPGYQLLTWVCDVPS